MNGYGQADKEFKRGAARVVIGLLLGGAMLAAAAQDKGTVYRCPGNLYTDQITSKEAAARGCRTIEGAPVTVVQPIRKAAPTGPAAAAQEAKVEAEQQRQRDSDRRRILESELKREEDRLAALQKEYNNGQPERLGGEANFQKYLDRTAELKAQVERSQSDVAALKRELAKLPPAN
ncbi:hypothetical protein [Rivibacter subsaxonicus]|uniref:DUF4124 domain-containing protein n=1 Tax=Rivibacter subsaxonicus TaxID=457575 RepID=A0A4Q7W2X2_9BURK|nr:hypothetical protein [Rivibacter subsaxonicus]RZU03119.1 hypothetical protein EV670_1152 [Rivibacter subsaxonicus]